MKDLDDINWEKEVSDFIDENPELFQSEFFEIIVDGLVIGATSNDEEELIRICEDCNPEFGLISQKEFGSFEESPWNAPISKKRFEPKITKHIKLIQSFGPRDTDLDNLPQTERAKFCYCKEGETHCGICDCGKPGHTRSYLFMTGAWCDDCYYKLTREDCE